MAILGKRVLLFLSLLLIGNSAFAQNNSSLGFWGNGALNMHNHDLMINTTKFNGNTNYLNGAFGFHYNYKINDMFVLSGRAGLNFLGANLDSGTSQVDLSMMNLELTPAVQVYNLIPVNNLYLLGGLEIGLPIGNTYAFNSAATNDLSTKLRVGLALGVGYDYQLNNNWSISPEVSFRFGLNDVINYTSTAYSGTDGIDQIRFGVNITYHFKDEEVIKDNVIKDEGPADLKIGFGEVKYYDNAGKSYPLEKVKLEDFQYTEQFPLVPYVFFDENSEKPNTKTTILAQEPKTGEFTIKTLEPDAVLINNKTLDIIGSRLKESTNSELTITGTNDNKAEKKDKSLSLKRAEWAKDYLVKNYEINPDRINVKSIGLPEKASSSNVEDGIEENRRIEFSSSNPKILEPIIMQSENQRLASPNLIEFVPIAESKDSLAKWKLEIYQGSKLLREFEGTGNSKPLQWVIYPNELMNKQVPVDYTFTAETYRGVKKSANGTVPTEYYSISRKKSEELPDKSISKYSLMLFDFDKYEISEKDMAIINEYIIPAIKYNSSVQIFGYTDRIGEDKYNKKLATQRAEAVRDLLKSKIKTANIEVIGVGEGNFIFDNDLPTGRQLSRTVQVYVSTPKN